MENTTTKTLPRNEEPARSLSVLVVEDNQVNQRIVTAMLEKQGHTVRIAQNGKEALEVNSTDKFDVILMDIQMPIMGGEEAVAHIRAAEKERSLPHIPIIALTAHAMRGDREKYLAAGMDAYVAKPIDKDELLNAIARLVVKKPL